MLNNYTDGKIRQGYKFGYIRTNYSTYILQVVLDSTTLINL